MKTKLFTRNIALGILMTLAMAFSVPGVCDPLQITATSPTIQTKGTLDPAFEIQFSVRMNSNAIAYDAERRRVDDRNANPVRIDSSGYRVTYLIDGKAYRNSTAATALTDASYIVGPRPKYHDNSSGVDLPATQVSQSPATGDKYVDTRRDVVDSAGVAVYRRTGGGNRADTDANTPDDPWLYERAKADPSSPIPERDTAEESTTGDRFDYNDERIRVQIREGTTASTGITFQVKGTNYVVVDNDELTESSGILRSSMTLVGTSSEAGTYTITIEDATPERDYPDGVKGVDYPQDLDSDASGLKRSKEVFTLYVTTDESADTTFRILSRGGQRYSRIDTGEPIEPVSNRFGIFTATGTTRITDFTGANEGAADLEIRYKVTSGDGTLFVGADSKTVLEGPKTDLTAHRGANVFLNTNRTDNRISASIAGQDHQTFPATIEIEYTGADRRTTTTPSTQQPTQQPIQQQPQVTTLTVPSSLSGAPGSTQTLRITSPVRPTVGTLTDTFRTAGGSATSAAGAAPLYTTTLTLPSTPGTYSLTVAAGLTTTRSVTVTVTGAAGTTSQAGDLFITSAFSGAPGSQSVVTVRATDANGNPASEVSVALGVTNAGGTFSPATVTTGTDGTATSTLTRGNTPGNNYFITARANNYDTVQSRISITGTQPAAGDDSVSTPAPRAAGEADAIDVYDGNNQRGIPNVRLSEPLVVEVVDANDNPVANERVTFRATRGSGRFSPARPRTDRNGRADTTFTPTSSGTIRIAASVEGVTARAVFTITTGEPPASLTKVSGDSQSGTPGSALANPFVVEVKDADGETIEGIPVTFSVTAGGGSLSATSATTDEDGRAETTLTLGSRAGVNSVEASVSGVDPVIFSTSVDAKILVAAANRPVMYWIANGALYRLAGAKEAKIAENVNGVAVGGGKLYWTAQTGISAGTINSANLDGSGATVLTAIMAVPIGIAVDTANSLLYWTNSRGRIQSATLTGKSIRNVRQNLSDPTDIVVSNGFIYWTEGGDTLKRVNIKGQKQVQDVAANLDTVGGLAVSGGKVYWTEATGASAGTINAANLNGTQFKTLATLLSAPMGIAVDTAGSKLYWTNGRGRVQSANLDGSKIRNVVDGLIAPSKLAIGGANAATATPTATAKTPAKKDNAKYDVNGDGSVDNVDAGLVIGSLGTTTARYDVDGDGSVTFTDVQLILNNRDAGAAGAPMLVGMKLSAVQIERLQEQIDLLIATGDRSPAAMRTLVYLQQLLATARPEKTQLLANYPNPFNPETWIPYELATDTNVKLTIYNAQGVVIRVLHLGQQSAGYYTDRERAAYWDGRNALGEQVASGIYFYQLETDDMSSLRKMVILK